MTRLSRVPYGAPDVHVFFCGVQDVWTPPKHIYEEAAWLKPWWNQKSGAESQPIAGTSRLEWLQYPLCSKSSTKDSIVNIVSNCQRCLWRTCLCITTFDFVVRARRVSGLEAFSRYPTHGSFSALNCRSTEFTGHVKQRFLSYWVDLLLAQLCNSRIKLTCLATV